MTLFKIGIIEIDYKTLLIFILGLIAGLLIFGIAFLIIMLSTRRNKDYVIRSSVNVSADDANALIKSTVEDFRLAIKDKESKIFVITWDMSKDLMNNMAKLFFPNKKRPLFELSIDELIGLLNTTADNIDKRLDERFLLKAVKNKRLSTFVLKAEKKTENVSVLKEEKNKSSVLRKMTSVIGDKIKNIGKQFSKKAIELTGVVPSACELIIHVCGEECYKVFAQKIKQDDTIDSGIDKIEIAEVDEIENAEEK